MLVVLMFQAVIGCSVVKMAKGREGIDISEISPGIARSQVEKVLCKPIRCWTSSTNVHYCLYKYDAGRPPDYGEAAAAGFLDIISLGAWEIFEATSRDVEVYYPATIAGLILSYDPNDYVLGVFDEFAFLPPDGRSEE